MSYKNKENQTSNQSSFQPAAQLSAEEDFRGVSAMPPVWDAANGLPFPDAPGNIAPSSQIVAQRSMSGSGNSNLQTTGHDLSQSNSFSGGVNAKGNNNEMVFEPEEVAHMFNDEMNFSSQDAYGLPEEILNHPQFPAQWWIENYDGSNHHSLVRELMGNNGVESSGNNNEMVFEPDEVAHIFNDEMNFSTEEAYGLSEEILNHPHFPAQWWAENFDGSNIQSLIHEAMRRKQWNEMTALARERENEISDNIYRRENLQYMMSDGSVYTERELEIIRLRQSYEGIGNIPGNTFAALFAIGSSAAGRSGEDFERDVALGAGIGDIVGGARSSGVRLKEGIREGSTSGGAMNIHDIDFRGVTNTQRGTIGHARDVVYEYNGNR